MCNLHGDGTGEPDKVLIGSLWQALAGMKEGPLEQVPIQDYFPAAKELSPVQFA